ncbi:MAG TPA: hydroxyisourate hydrolase [Acetobacteraceae bacterium]|nr:hydroxyisourate hydrolase [Acetobacteraceae bacterium]
MSEGRLTVHVLDTARGTPAAGIALDLFRLDAAGRTHLGQWRTNADGRCDTPLLAGAALTAGAYEVVFAVRPWRAARGEPDPGFYDDIPIRFQVSDPTAHYHVPLLIAPHGYTTYRGS